jgi:hypothetical protein
MKRVKYAIAARDGSNWLLSDGDPQAGFEQVPVRTARTGTVSPSHLRSEHAPSVKAYDDQPGNLEPLLTTAHQMSLPVKILHTVQRFERLSRESKGSHRLGQTWMARDFTTCRFCAVCQSE